MQRHGKWFVVLVGLFVLFNLLTGSASAAKVLYDERIGKPHEVSSKEYEAALAAKAADTPKKGEAEGQLVYVRVLNGDTAWGITRKCDRPGTDFGTLLAYNPQLPKAVDQGKDVYVRIHEGQVLTLPLGWRINPSHLNSVEYLNIPDLGPSVSTPEENRRRDYGAWFLPLLLVCLVAGILYLIHRHFARHAEEREMDPNRYSAMIDGGLHSDAGIAKAQIEENYSGREGRISRCERGIIRSASGTGALTVSMCFGDGITRNVRLESGMAAHRVTLINGSVEFYRSHCGNLIGPEVRSGQFILPAGWEFVPDRDTVARADFPPTAPPAPPTPAKTEPPAAEPANRQGCCTGAAASRMEGVIKITVTVGDTPPRSIEVSGKIPSRVFLSSSGNGEVIYKES
jgi:hypothetical protein